MSFETLWAMSGAVAPVLTAGEMIRWDRRAIEAFGILERTLVESAGRAAANIVQHFYPEGTVVAAVGSGNNGADALVVLRTLAARGRCVVAVDATGKLPEEGLAYGWSVPIRSTDAADDALHGAAVIVDGLLGTGARGAPRAPYAELIRKINEAGAPVVSLDGPSGIDLTNGRAEGDAVRADLTIAFGALKRGLCLFPGRAHAGRIVVVEVGFPPLESASAAGIISPGWAMRRLPVIPPDAHKGTLGKVLVIAGHPGMGGAAIMVGMGALRAGAGAVRIASPSENRVAIQTAIPEALYVDRESSSLEEVSEAADSIVLGPGMGIDDGAREALRVALSASTCPVVLDADALTMVAEDPKLLPSAGRDRILLTPHPGEMSRLLGRPTDDITADPFGAASEASERFGCSVLLKGAPSIVASHGHQTLVNLTGHSGVATGGMGDTLAGVCAAFMAAGMAPREAGALAIYFAGRAAEIAGRGRSLLPRDVAEGLSQAFERNGASAAAETCPEVILQLPPPR